jgi:hypothetical protein
MTKDQARLMARRFAEYAEKSEQATTATRAAAQTREQQELDRNWGANKEAFLFIARQAVKKLGWDADTINKLEGVVGYGKLMEGLRTLGTAMGEDKFVANRGPGGTGPMTREQAKATLAEKRADKEWVKRFSEQSAAKPGREWNEFMALTEMATAA